MSYVEPGRWSCPQCSRTFTAYGSDADCAAAIKAVQERHARGHAAAEDVLARLGLPEPIRNNRKRRAA